MGRNGRFFKVLSFYCLSGEVVIGSLVATCASWDAGWWCLMVVALVGGEGACRLRAASLDYLGAWPWRRRTTWVTFSDATCSTHWYPKDRKSTSWNSDSPWPS